MSVKQEKTLKIFKEAMKASDEKGTKPYDAVATVVRVEDNTAWVHFDNGVIETPAKMTISCKAGDTVQVRVSGGSAWIIGNATAPPTDDTTASIAWYTAEDAKDNAHIAVNLAELAQEVAIRAQTSADGKSTIYYGDIQPATGVAGDTWFNEAEDNAIYIFDGQFWVKQELGEDAIADLSVTNAKIANGTIQSAKIANVDAGKITSGTIDTNRLDVNGIISVGEIATDAEVLVVHNEALDGRKYADNYLTVISQTTGISVHDEDDTSNYVNISSSAINIVQNGSNVASFGSTVRIGEQANTHISMGSTQIDIRGTDGAQIAYFGQNSRFGRATDSYVDVTPYHVELVRSTDGTLEHRVSLASFGESIRVGPVNGGHTIIDGNGMEVFNGATSLASFGATVRVGASNTGHTFISAGGMSIYGSTGNTKLADIGYGRGYNPSGTQVDAPYFTFGTRASPGDIGNYSFLEGHENVASGYASHAEGEYNNAYGWYSHAQNKSNSAFGYAQTVIGEYNKSNGQNKIRVATDYAFIIGNGTSNSARSNAFAVDWDGYLYRGDTQIPIVVETGTSGGWQYAKWSDGRVELWGFFSQSATAYATNSFVIGSSSVTAYPFTITAPRTVVTGQKIGTGGCVVDYDYGRTDYWSGIAHGTVSSWAQGSTQTITWTCYVNARWK